SVSYTFFFFQAEDGIRDGHVTGVQTCALPIWHAHQLLGAEGLLVEVDGLRRFAQGELWDDGVPTGRCAGRALGRGCASGSAAARSEEHTSELQSRGHLVCRLLLEKKKKEKCIF